MNALLYLRPGTRRAAGPNGTLGRNVAPHAGEGFGLAGVAGVAAHEAPVRAREDRRLLTKQFGCGHRRASGKGPRGLFAHSDH